MIPTICQSCNAVLEIPDEYEGQSGRCPRCGGSLTVPPRNTLHSKPAPGGVPAAEARSFLPTRTAEIRRLRSTAAQWTAAGVLICGFLLVDYVTPWLFGGGLDDLPSVVCLGLCIGQVNLIATWAALAPGNIILRLPWALLLGVLMWYSLVLGARVENEHLAPEQAITLGIVLFGGIVAAQAPLWVARRRFGWRLTGGPGEGTAPHGPLQFQLRQMLLGMLLVSLALAPARLVLPKGPMESDSFDRELLVVLAAVTVSNLLITVPCIWGAFSRRRFILPLILVWLLYCGVVTATEFGSLVAALGPPGPGSEEVALWIYGINVSQCAAVFGSLLILRAAGLELARIRSR